MSALEVWTTGKNLPPGLWIPTADEPTDRYLAENFAGRELEPEELSDLGSFVVARVAYEQDQTERVSLMPVLSDFDELYKAGYGFSSNTLVHRHGGIKRVQRLLGFYPHEFMPSAEEVIERFQWIADHAYALDPLPGALRDVGQIMLWGSVRNLTPSRNKTYKILKGNTTILRKMFGVEHMDWHGQYSYLDMYRFGALVIHENNGPISVEELNKRYADRFVSTPEAAIRLSFKTMNRFWQEFDYLPPRSHGLTKEDILSFGVRRVITVGKVEIDRPIISALSLQMKFPSMSLIDTHFGGVPAYREAVRAAFKQYIGLRNEFCARGVSPLVFNAVCRNFHTSTAFEAHLRTNTATLLKLSADSNASKYVATILRHGFNLLDERIMDMQFEDFIRSLNSLGVRREQELRFVFDHVPRYNTDEALERLRRDDTRR